MQKMSFRKTFLNSWTMAFLKRLHKILGIIKTWSNITFEGITYSRDWENWDQDEQASIPWLSIIVPKEDSNVSFTMTYSMTTCSPCMEGKPMGSHGR